jgi:hypothetical protein
MHLTTNPANGDSFAVASDASVAAGAPEENEIEITPEMIEAGLLWLYAYSPSYEDGRATVIQIIKSALAIRFRRALLHEPCRDSRAVD